MFSGGVELLFSVLLLSGGDARRRVVLADPDGGLQIELVRCVLYPAPYIVYCMVVLYSAVVS